MNMTDQRVIERRRPVWGYWLVIVLLLMALGVAGYMLWQGEARSEALRGELGDINARVKTDSRTILDKERLIESLGNQLEAANRQLMEATSDLAQLTDAASQIAPLLITDIELRPITDRGQPVGDYGNLTTDMHYIEPRIIYYGFRTGQHPLQVRIIDPAGNMRGNGDYTYTTTRALETGPRRKLQLSGYGYDAAGRWPAGVYAIEVWYRDTRLARKLFKVT